MRLRRGIVLLHRYEVYALSLKQRADVRQIRAHRIVARQRDEQRAVGTQMVPQKRERLITIGIRNDLADRCQFTFPQEHDYKPVVRDIQLDTNPDATHCARYSKNKEAVFALVPPGGYWRDIDPIIAKAYMKTCWDMGGGRTGILSRIGLDEPSLTVLTNPGMKQTDRCHPLEVRPFSVRENARLQSFPDEWIFCGKLSEQYKQVGNAVPVNLAKEIGLEILRTLEAL